ncbi:MAG: YfhO family protein [Bacteroidetes bacterium]|nr:YfhO family protein [Bacteroidota bacterium]
MQKRFLPHAIAVAIFSLLTIIYFLPYYQGMTLSQGDVTQWEGMSKEINDWNAAHPDDQALWTGRLFSGMPAFQISMHWAGNFVNKLVKGLMIIFPNASVLMFLSFFGFYILLLCLDISPTLSIAGSLAYGLSTFTLISIEAGHNTKVQAMSLMAPVLGGVLLAYRKNILLGAAITALFLSMAIDANHLQVAYYILMMLGLSALYFFVEGVLEKQLPRFAKASAALVIAGLLALLPNVGNLWSTQEYAKETIRGGTSELTQKKEATKGGGLDFDYATRWSYGAADGEIFTLLIPNMKGGGSGNTLSDNNAAVKKFEGSGYDMEQVKRYVGSLLYWGNQPFTSGPVYVGAGVFFLFIFSFFVVRSNYKWALLAITLFAVFLSFGKNTPFFGWMFNLLPFFNKFRTPAMALVIAQVTIPLLGMMGLHEILSGKISGDELLKKLKVSSAISIGLVVLVGVLGSFTYSYAAPNDAELAKNNAEMLGLIKTERASMLRADAFRSIFFMIVVAGLLWSFIQKKTTATIFTVAIATVLFLDGFMVAKRYLNSSNFVEASEQGSHPVSQADVDILKDTDPHYRVFNVTRDPFNDAMTSYYHKSIGGYHAAKLIRYQDLIENQISKNNMRVLNMLNTKYFIVENPQNKQPAAQRNPDALGNAWFVSELKWADNADAEMAALTDLDTRWYAVADLRYKNILNAPASFDSSGSIRLLTYSPNILSYESNAAQPQLAVFSEVFYNHGWKAFIDEKEVPYGRVNYVLRALNVPAGKHTITFRFQPESVVAGSKIAYAGSFLLFAFVIGTLGFSLKKEWTTLETEEPKRPKQATDQPKSKKK